MCSENLLDIKNLRVHLSTPYGVIKAVDGIDLSIKKGETLGLVGESGSGKTITALSILRLIPELLIKTIEGEIIFTPLRDKSLTGFNSKDILKMNERELIAIRGKEIAMVFQEPFTSLNPVFTIGEQLTETIMAHQKVDKKEAFKKSVEVLELVGVSSPEERLFSYPHSLSGGLRQRAMIAMAISCNPTLLIADEPTTALDVTVQASILSLLSKLKKELALSIFIITHDFGVIAEIADNVAVMREGKIVEYSDVESIFSIPKHPYTEKLLNSLPKL